MPSLAPEGQSPAFEASRVGACARQNGRVRLSGSASQTGPSRGRPRKVGAREPNGRLSRAAAKALEREVTDEIRPDGLISPLEIRRFWIKAAGAARVEAFGTPVGQLLLFGKLDEAQYSAARSWAKLAARYRLAIEAPGTPRSAVLERIGSHSVGAAAAPGDGVDKVVIDRFLAARGVLLALGWSVERTVRECCEELGRLPAGYAELLRLRDGLSALARLWRLKGRAETRP
jgi:hypothetical protein